jgi:excisionase family DNA binding protein
MMLTTSSPDLPILTIREAAELLRVSERKIMQWKAEGRLQAMTYPGRITRFRRRDCLALVSGADLGRQPLFGAAGPA